ncbi:hypothetical protein P3T25_009508 [Paraburkholderia sp. GAS32]|jgi:hypothetical protein
MVPGYSQRSKGRPIQRRLRKKWQGFDSGLASTSRGRGSTGPRSSFPVGRAESPVQIRQRSTDRNAGWHLGQCPFKPVQQFRQTHFTRPFPCELPLLHKAAPLYLSTIRAGADVTTNRRDPATSVSSCLLQQHRRRHLPLARVASAHRDGQPHPRRSGQCHRSAASQRGRFPREQRCPLLPAQPAVHAASASID